VNYSKINLVITQQTHISKDYFYCLPSEAPATDSRSEIRLSSNPNHLGNTEKLTISSLSFTLSTNKKPGERSSNEYP